jgi:hypothetical protein
MIVDKCNHFVCCDDQMALYCEKNNNAVAEYMNRRFGTIWK